jgi:HEAT repeat protein
MNSGSTLQSGPKRHVIKAAIVFIVAFAVLITFLRPFYPAQPVHNGKPLIAWAQQYGSNNWTANRAAAEEAQVAIRQIGTNSIPFLLRLMESRESSLKKRFRQVLPRKWHATLRLEDQSGDVRRIGAHGLAALGTNAPGAVPPLIELAKNHPDEDGRYLAVFALRTLGPAAEPAVPFYIQCLTNKDGTIRNEAAVGLVLIPRHWNTTFPPLLEYLESIKESRGWELPHAIQLMGQMGTNARPAVPVLTSLLSHSQADVRQAVTNSLLWIDPDAANKAGIKDARAHDVEGLLH